MQGYCDHHSASFADLCLYAGFPWSWKILEKIAVMESHGKVLEYENFQKKSWKVAGCHGKVMELLVLMAMAAF